MTAISDLGEFGLIDLLTSNLPKLQGDTLKGVGDDCAVFAKSEGEAGKRQVSLITSDMLLEGIHFDLVYTPFKHLGYKAAQVNFSDVYAMNGRPKHLLANIGVDRRISVEQLQDLYDGLALACQDHGVDLVGGDTCTSLTGLTLSITCVGEANEADVAYRSGARENDLICVSGNLGAAYLGLQLLEREKMVFESRPSDMEAAQPDFAGKEYLLERFLKPEARKDIVERLAKAGIRPTAMMDVSDGLSSELLHICKASNCGCRLYEERIPIDYQTAVTAEEFNLNVYTCALNGGEDYELLFTVPLDQHEAVKDIEDVKVIGHITSADAGARYITRDQKEFDIKAQGFKAF